MISAGGGGNCGSVMTAWIWMYSKILVVYMPCTSMSRGSIPFAELCLYSKIFVGVDAYIKSTRRSV